MNAICVVVDGLHAGFLGCYGNAWVETPAIDRLAVEGFVFDQALIDSPEIEQIYRGYWQGRHVLAPAESCDPEASLPTMLAASGTQTALITDERELIATATDLGISEIVQLPAAARRTAATSDGTHLAGFFSAASDWLQAAREPFCLWLHTQGMIAAWDAPSALRERYAEEEEISPPTFVDPPSLILPDDHDPDLLLALRWAYAAQVTVLDRCLEAFLEWFDAQPAARETLLVLIGARGYPLGEHRRVGLAPSDGSALHEELVHVPWIVRFPDRAGAADRCRALVQPADLAWTLAEWFQLAGNRLAPCGQSWLPLVRQQAASQGDKLPWRDRVCLLASQTQERAIRTAAWHLILPAKLYAKPDDRWEVNEVADRCGEVAELLANAYEELARASQRGRPADVSPLREVLAKGLE